MRFFPNLCGSEFFDMKKGILIALMAVSAVAVAQPANNKLKFKKGQTFEVYTQMNRTAQQEMMGQSMESSVSSASFTHLNVTDATSQDATLLNTTKRIKFDMSIMGRDESFDSDNPDDMKSDIGKMMGDALNAKYYLTIDPSGTITGVKDDESDKKKKANDQAAGMMAMFTGSMGGGKPKAGDPSLFRILPNKPLSKGLSWTDEIKDENGTRTTVYTIADITASDILIDFDENSTLDIKQEMMGQSATVNVKAKSNGKIVLDKATGILKQKTFVTNSEENISAAGMTIPSTSKMTTTITVKPL